MEKYNNYKDSVDTVALGELIAQCDERNSDNAYTEDDVRGISTSKEFISTKANLDGVSLTSYKVVNPGQFVYVADTSRRGEKIALAYNDSCQGYLISSIYTVFSVDTNRLLPEYLFLLLSRSEFDRYSRFNSWGSARETFDWDEMCRVKIPLPSIETQRELVTLYKGLKTLAEQNEAMLKPLSDACQAFIVDCKKKYQMVKLGDYIVECDERNTDNKLKIDSVRGISIEKKLIDTKADMNGVSLSPYKILKTKDICYVSVTSRNGGKISLALNSDKQSYLVSSSYITFTICDKQVLLPEFLFLLISHSEFDRYSRYNSWGSARETFDWEEMCRVEIPLPPIEVQQSIVSLYTCYEECKRIAKESREQLKNICPALVQKAGEC